MKNVSTLTKLQSLVASKSLRFSSDSSTTGCSINGFDQSVMMLKVHLCTSMRVVQIFHFIFLNCHSSLLHIILDSYRARIRMKLIFIALVALLIVSARGADEGKRGPKVTHKVFFDISIDGKEIGKLLYESKTQIYHNLLEKCA